MATLALSIAGAAVGGAILPAGISFLGATLTGAAIGSQLGALAGSYVDQALFGSSGQSRTVEGPRLKDVHMTSSTEGLPIPKLFGRARLGGNVIWADDINERIVRSESNSGGGKGGLGGGSGTGQIEYIYSASFAIGLTQGSISGIGRVWADGQEINTAELTYRLYNGSETQAADPLIVERLGAANAPAFRGTAYIVFQGLPLAAYGNRIPQFSFEIYRSVEPFGDEIKGIVLIPASGEFVYSPTAVTEVTGDGVGLSENVHTREGATDWDASLKQLDSTLPNAKSVSLTVSWFGTDLRCGNCQIKPGVDRRGKITEPLVWGVSGATRADAHLISLKDARPAFGGTPSDQSVVAAIQDLKARGHEVVLTPFILMDIGDTNTLPNPYGGSSQPNYPWRGRITCFPAPGQPGTVDKTAAAAAQVAAFVGTVQASHFSIAGTEVTYTGPNEWSLRRMVLHQAHLAKAAGGVTAFVIGTELRGLTAIRSSASSFPFVNALATLAADVKAVLGAGTKVTYAADWSEYFGYQPADGSNDVYFHLDPLWASAAIDAIGIDLYWPLADWRDGTAHLDFLAGTRSGYDLDYLRSNVQGGEGYDWYYASDANRAAQIRTPITDGLGKPWVFRYKDIKSWWLNPHYNRPLGVESTTPTAWVPQSKPFWIMETGCPCIDKGANQPNVFVDPKSSESFIPYFSRGTRDDLIQRRFLRAFIQAFDPTSAGYVPGANPLSTVYGQRMLDLARIHIYAWDARPFPAFPDSLAVWGDGDNWRFGHWLNGRFSAAPLSETVADILTGFEFETFDTSKLQGIVSGYVIDRVMSARDALQPLELAYFFDSVESGSKIVFRQRGAEPVAESILEEATVETRPGEALITLTRGQETELPASAKISYIGASGDYRQAVAEARRLKGASGRVAQAELPIVIEAERATEMAESWLFESWAARERAAFTLPPSALAIEPGDVINLQRASESRLVRVIDVADHGARAIEARGIDPDVYGGVPASPRVPLVTQPEQAGRPLVEFLDLPLLQGDEPPHIGYAACFQSPWPGGVSVYGSPETAGYQLKSFAPAPATVGVTLDDVTSGPLGVVDYGSKFRVRLSHGELSSVSLVQMLGGQNLAALKNQDGQWEVIQFEKATLVAPSTYELDGLLRGQGGTETAMQVSLAAGARFVLLTAEIEQVEVSLSDIRLPLNWRYGPSNRDIGDTSYAGRVHSFQGLGLKPLSPAHIRATRTAGDASVTWQRRTRIGGDGWDTPDVPLSEASEAYEIDVMAGAVVKRTLTSATPSVVYSAAQQITDFGALQPTIALNVYQMSSLYGRGTAKTAVV
jgi:hypothetical protein